MNRTESLTSELEKNQGSLKGAPPAYRTGPHLDPAAREHLLMEELPQVRCIARRIHGHLPHHVPLEDLVHAGVLGLMEAVHKFDPTKNVALRSYAKYRIRGAILDSLREMDWSPRLLRRRARQLEQAREKLHARLGRPATEAELAEELNIKLAELHRLLTDLRGLEVGSLQTEFSEDGYEQGTVNHLSNSAGKNPLELCLQSEMKALLAQAIGDLPARERQVVALYYYQELPMKEVGALLGVGEARISQIHSASRVRLRARMGELLGSRGLGRLAATRTCPTHGERAGARF
jgi:RNA polymerase sigma factor for flagellar operon FliA